MSTENPFTEAKADPATSDDESDGESDDDANPVAGDMKTDTLEGLLATASMVAVSNMGVSPERLDRSMGILINGAGGVAARVNTAMAILMVSAPLSQTTKYVFNQQAGKILMKIKNPPMIFAGKGGNYTAFKTLAAMAQIALLARANTGDNDTLKTLRASFAKTFTARGILHMDVAGLPETTKSEKNKKSAHMATKALLAGYAPAAYWDQLFTSLAAVTVRPAEREKNGKMSRYQKGK